MKLHKCGVCVYWGLNGLVKLKTTFAVYREFTTLCNHTVFQLVLSDAVLQRNYFYMFMILYAATDQSAVWGSASDCQSTLCHT